MTSSYVPQIAGNSTVCSTAYLGKQQQRHQSYVILSLCKGSMMDSPHKKPVIGKRLKHYHWQSIEVTLQSNVIFVAKWAVIVVTGAFLLWSCFALYNDIFQRSSIPNYTVKIVWPTRFHYTHVSPDGNAIQKKIIHLQWHCQIIKTNTWPLLFCWDGFSH